MKLTCVTAVYNAIASGNRENLIRCVQSVAKLKTPHEHLIIDGASNDGCVELLTELAKTTPGVVLRSEPDTGIYNALNKGLAMAQGEWFYVLGSDDYICHPEVMDSLLEDVVVNVGVIVAPVERNGKNPFFKKMSDLQKIFWTVPYSHQGLIMRTKVVRGFGGFDESYRICADWDIMLKAHEQLVFHKYTYKPFAFYACNGLSECGDGKGWMEVGMVLASHLHLTDEKLIEFRKVGYPPTRTMIPFLWHRDCAFRMGARMMIWRRIKSSTKNILRIAFYPLVIITRPVRHRTRW